PPWVDDRVIGWTYQQVLAWLTEIQHDPTHPARGALDDMLKRLAADLQHDPEVMEQAEALKVRLLTHPQVPETAVGLWRSFRASLTAAMDDETSYFHTRGDELLEHLGRHLVDDEVWRGRLEARLGEGGAVFVHTLGNEAGAGVSGAGHP